MNYTTIEQSKKLIEAGLDPETADMWYAERYTGHHKPNGLWYTDEEPYYYLSLLQPSKENYSIDVIKDIPCWSLGQLIGLMPNSIGWGVSKVIIGNQVLYINLQEYAFNGNSLYESDKPELIDSVVETIIWLLKNNYIKKEETK